MKISLMVLSAGKAAGQALPITVAQFIIGRDPECNLRPASAMISKRHCAVIVKGNQVFLRDFDSTNGTFVNDQSITHSRLHDGDYLRVGNCIYRFLSGGNLESEYHEEIYRLTIIEALTGINNQRYLLEFLDREMARSARHHRPMTLVMIDIDHFKRVNDEHGHLGGDFALRELANCIKKIIRREDCFARYGGEEFALVLVETQLNQAQQITERIREVIEGMEIKFDNKIIRMTVSIGLAFTCGDANMSVNQLIRQADDQLYKAKTGGRNRVSS